MRNKSGIFNLTLLCSALFTTGLATAADSIGEPGRSSGQKNALKNVYFGEQHLHTAASPDAFAVGTRGTGDDAYRYAKGEEVKLSTTGKKISKKTPYDFVAITDHSEYFGVMPRLIDPKDPLSKTDFAKKLQDKKAKNDRSHLGDQYYPAFNPDQYPDAGIRQTRHAPGKLGGLCQGR